MTGLPEWLLAGLVLGAVFAVLSAAAFLVGGRLLPAGGPATSGATPGEGRRRAEIRRYLSALGEPFVEDRRVAGQRVAFYLTDRDVAITFDARAYFRLERAGVRAVLVEHELPGAGLGARLPFDTPTPGPRVGPDWTGETGRGPGPRSNASATGRGPGGPRDRPPGRGGLPGTRDPVAAALSVLGLPPDADEAAVRAAYREKVKEVHPDHGGDPEAFRRVREAYAVARDR